MGARQGFGGDVRLCFADGIAGGLVGGVCGEVFELTEVVDVVAGHGFDDGPEGHGAALRVGGGAVAVVLGDGGEEEQVPVAGGGEEGQCGFRSVGGVAFGPGVLVEGLDDGVLLGEGLAEAEGEDELTVGEVGDDLADAPFAGGRGRVELRAGEAGGEGVEALCGGGKDGDGVLAVQAAGVRI